MIGLFVPAIHGALQWLTASSTLAAMLSLLLWNAAGRAGGAGPRAIG